MTISTHRKKSTKNPKEKTVEQHLYDRVKEQGGVCIKLEPGKNPSVPKGFPDRLVILRGASLVETKRPKGGYLSSVQVTWKKIINEEDCDYYVLSTKQEVDKFIKERLAL